MKNIGHISIKINDAMFDDIGDDDEEPFLFWI